MIRDSAFQIYDSRKSRCRLRRSLMICYRVERGKEEGKESEMHGVDGMRASVTGWRRAKGETITHSRIGSRLAAHFGLCPPALPQSHAGSILALEPPQLAFGRHPAATECSTRPPLPARPPTSRPLRRPLSSELRVYGCTVIKILINKYHTGG